MGTRYAGTRAEKRALDAYIKLVRAAQSVSARVEGPLDGLGLTVSQFGALEALFHLGPLNQRSLAAKILRSPGNITMVVDNLERRGLARRVRGEPDRRHFLVTITPGGADLIRSCFPAHAGRITRQMGALAPAEQEELARLCRKVGLASVRDGDPAPRRGGRTKHYGKGRQ